MQNKPSWMLLDGGRLTSTQHLQSPSLFISKLDNETGEVFFLKERERERKNHCASEFGFYTFGTTTLAIGRYCETQPVGFVTRQRVSVCSATFFFFLPCYLIRVLTRHMQNSYLWAAYNSYTQKKTRRIASPHGIFVAVNYTDTEFVDDPIHIFFPQSTLR